MWNSNNLTIILGSFFFPLIPAWIVVERASTSLSDFWEKMGSFMCWYSIGFSLVFTVVLVVHMLVTKEY